MQFRVACPAYLLDEENYFSFDDAHILNLIPDAIGWNFYLFPLRVKLPRLCIRFRSKSLNPGGKISFRSVFFGVPASIGIGVGRRKHIFKVGSLRNSYFCIGYFRKKILCQWCLYPYVWYCTRYSAASLFCVRFSLVFFYT